MTVLALRLLAGPAAGAAMLAAATVPPDDWSEVDTAFPPEAVSPPVPSPLMLLSLLPVSLTSIVSCHQDTNEQE